MYEMPHLMGLHLADPSFHVPGRIDVLLGADIYPQIMVKQSMVTGALTDPAAQPTIFGWAIVGPVTAKGTCSQQVPTHFMQSQTVEDDSTNLPSKMLKEEELEQAALSSSPVEEQVQTSSADDTSCSSSCQSQETCPSMDDVQDHQDLRTGKVIPASQLTLDPTAQPSVHSVTRQSCTSILSEISLNHEALTGLLLHPALDSTSMMSRATLNDLQEEIPAQEVTNNSASSSPKTLCLDMTSRPDSTPSDITSPSSSLADSCSTTISSPAGTSKPMDCSLPETDAVALQPTVMSNLQRETWIPPPEAMPSPVQPTTISTFKWNNSVSSSLPLQPFYTVKDASGLPREPVHSRAESSTALAWPDGQHSNINMHVPSSTSDILQITSPQPWTRPSTADHTADCSPRRVKLKNSICHDLWWFDPVFLLQELLSAPCQPPKLPFSTQISDSTVSVICCNIVHAAPPPWMEELHCSSHQLLSITSWCLMICHRLQHSRPPDPSNGSNQLAAQQLAQAKHWLPTLLPAGSLLREEHPLLQNHPSLPTSKKTAMSACTALEQSHKVGLRFSSSAVTLHHDHLLSHNCQSTSFTLLFTSTHVCCGPAGPTLLFCFSGWRFHLVGDKLLSQAVCIQSKVCRQAATNTPPQLLEELPAEHSIILSASNVPASDCAGSSTLKRRHTKQPALLKAYVCLLVSFVTIIQQIWNNLSKSQLHSQLNDIISSREDGPFSCHWPVARIHRVAQITASHFLLFNAPGAYQKTKASRRAHSAPPERTDHSRPTCQWLFPREYVRAQP